MQNEMWRPVADYDGIYEVSNMGRVRRVAKGQGARAGRVLTGKRDSGGYRQVNLTREGTKKRTLVHRLVAFAFLGSPPSPTANHVNHIDADRSNNIPSNLEWVTRKENTQHAVRLGRVASKLTEEQREEIVRLKESVSQRGLARRFSVARTLVQAIHNKAMAAGRAVAERAGG